MKDVKTLLASGIVRTAILNTKKYSPDDWKALTDGRFPVGNAIVGCFPQFKDAESMEQALKNASWEESDLVIESHRVFKTRLRGNPLYFPLEKATPDMVFQVMKFSGKVYAITISAAQAYPLLDEEYRQVHIIIGLRDGIEVCVNLLPEEPKHPNVFISESQIPGNTITKSEAEKFGFEFAWINDPTN